MTLVGGPPAWSARQVAALIAARRLSAREYLDVLLHRIARHNNPLRLVVTVDEEAAREQARRADETTMRGEPVGPLHGVAMTVKDSFNTAGLRTTAGSPELARHVPRRDADAVAALRTAGAVILGKTNLAENCADIQSANPVFGAAANPWRPSHTPGGSSGGSAGAVAAGFTPVELGSDIAGSIRIPAARCGVLGHRPSYGVVPLRGHLPPYQDITPDVAVAGPLARDADDLELLLDVLVAPSAADRRAWQVRLPPARPPRRVATWFDDPGCPVDTQVRTALEAAAEALRDQGLTVEPATPRGVTLPVSDEVGRRLLASVALHRGDGAPGGLGAEFAAQDYRSWMTADARRQRLRARWADFFEVYDAILLPVVPDLTGPHDLRPFAERRIVVNGIERPYWDQLAWTTLTGPVYLPTTVVPVGRDSIGLPIGMAITGPYLEDRTTVALARLLNLDQSIAQPADSRNTAFAEEHPTSATAAP